ncbi:hypothetical protein HK097_008260 [Rhizophlyctis rosea]|uniref:Alginate lyase domain-containing protein n=1 Tax=Rhizophlyctis rosea TaxID=64517 RepID=A0AAD5SC17_9FUNG|nr:hypothetical protein HK097_008260 [Rhizophlyctis rosea]
MRKTLHPLNLLLAATHLLVAHAKIYPIDSQGQPLPGAIETYYMDAENLWLNRDLYRSGRRELNPAINRIIRIATEASNDPTTYTVTAKPSNLLPPSNDIHDFYSLGRYYWPNGNTTDGLPYVRKDGLFNPEIYDLPDTAWLQVVINDVWACGLSYFYTGNETFVETGLKRLRDWFINENTKMNPNLNYAAWVKGTPAITDATPVTPGPGLLDLSKIYLLVDGISLLRTSPTFTPSDLQALQTWFRSYLSWLLTSPRGRGESTALNNQGTWYDIQLLSLYLLLSDSTSASSLIKNSTIPRMTSQIMPDGSMPLEQARADSWHYSTFAAEALFVVGDLAKNTGVGVFGFQTGDGRSLKRVIDYLVPYALNGGQGWPVPNSGNFSMDEIIELCKEAYIVYKDQKYLDAANQLQGNSPQTWNPMRLWAPYNVFDVPAASDATVKRWSVAALAAIAAVWACVM